MSVIFTKTKYRNIYNALVVYPKDEKERESREKRVACVVGLA